jgi:hypothetical protein
MKAMNRRPINDREERLILAILDSYGEFEGKQALVNQLKNLDLEILETHAGVMLKIHNGQPTNCKILVFEARYEDYDTTQKKLLREPHDSKEELLWCVPHVCVLFHIASGTGKPIALEFFKEDCSLLQNREPTESDLLSLGWSDLQS